MRQIPVSIILFLPLLCLAACGRDSSEHAEPGGHGVVKEDYEKGPHGGRVLRDGNLAIEVTIYEQGVPPEFRVYASEGTRTIDSSTLKLILIFIVSAAGVDSIRFKSRDDYLLGDQEIVEPHSFDVKVSAEYQGKSSKWEYSSYEGRTVMPPETAESSGIVIETAGPATIRSLLPVTGVVVPNGDRLSRIIARYPGVVREVRKRQGDLILKNEVLAVVESNESLQPYEVRSPIAGTVLEKNINAGEYSREGEPIFTIADLSIVWVELTAYRRDSTKLKPGQKVLLVADEGNTRAEAALTYISPLGSEHTQSTIARAEVQNDAGQWTTGLFVSAEIVIEETPVPVAVKTAALQTFRDWEVVFAQDGSIFEIAILELGKRDHDSAEVLKGLKAGQKYATENSFIIKADIGKSGASHDH